MRKSDLIRHPISKIGNYSAFIQILTKDNSYFLNYSFEDFSFSNSPFFIKIANNYFSLDEINIDINDSFHMLELKGIIHFSNNTSISSNFFVPNIMGPFSYFPFMECNHAILSMKIMLSIATIPSKGKMKREILESISSKIDVQIKEKDKIIFSNSGFNSGLKIVI